MALARGQAVVLVLFADVAGGSREQVDVLLLDGSPLDLLTRGGRLFPLRGRPDGTSGDEATEELGHPVVDLAHGVGGGGHQELGFLQLLEGGTRGVAVLLRHGSVLLWLWMVFRDPLLLGTPQRPKTLHFVAKKIGPGVPGNGLEPFQERLQAI